MNNYNSVGGTLAKGMHTAVDLYVCICVISLKSLDKNGKELDTAEKCNIISCNTVKIRITVLDLHFTIPTRKRLLSGCEVAVSSI